jgi:hypothetical protein
LGVDAIIQHGSTAYLIEAFDSPKPYEVENFTLAVIDFQQNKASSHHYKTVTSVVPVLAGRNWFEETDEATTNVESGFFWRWGTQCYSQLAYHRKKTEVAAVTASA